jgi:hypothetical protein
MRNKPIFTTLITLGLLAVLSTTLYGAASAHHAKPSIVGTWEVTIPTSVGNPRPTFYALLTFFADGNFIEGNSGNPAVTTPAHGVWVGSDGTYRLIFETFTFDAQGTYTGRVKAHLKIKMDGANHFNATYTADLIDLAGNVTKNVLYGPAEGTRLKLE